MMRILTKRTSKTSITYFCLFQYFRIFYWVSKYYLSRLRWRWLWTPNLMLYSMRIHIKIVLCNYRLYHFVAIVALHRRQSIIKFDCLINRFEIVMRQNISLYYYTPCNCDQIDLSSYVLFKDKYYRWRSLGRALIVLDYSYFNQLFIVTYSFFRKKLKFSKINQFRLKRAKNN